MNSYRGSGKSQKFEKILVDKETTFNAKTTNQIMVESVLGKTHFSSLRHFLRSGTNSFQISKGVQYASS